MSQLVAVTGITGNVGSEVAKSLLHQGEQVVAAVRHPARVEGVLATDPGFRALDYVELDFMRPETYLPALKGVDRLFLVRPPAITDTRRFINPVVDAAREAGVRRIVFLSLMGIEQNPFAPHWHVERHLRQSGVAFTFLRPSFFTQNFDTFYADDLRQHGEIFVPAGRGKTSFIDVRDIGAVAAQVLTSCGHERQAYTLTGPEALSYAEVARIFTEVWGRPVHYACPSPGEYRRRKLAEGQAADFVKVQSLIYLVARLGLAGRVTGETERLLRRRPLTVRQYATDYAARFGAAAEAGLFPARHE